MSAPADTRDDTAGDAIMALLARSAIADQINAALDPRHWALIVLPRLDEIEAGQTGQIVTSMPLGPGLGAMLRELADSLDQRAGPVS